MPVRLHPHAQERCLERGAAETEVIQTVEKGEQFPVKYGRMGFRKNFPFEGTWRGKAYTTKQVEVFAIQEGKEWLVITVIVRYF